MHRHRIIGDRDMPSEVIQFDNTTVYSISAACVYIIDSCAMILVLMAWVCLIIGIAGLAF